MESTKENRVWHDGPPPHVGWWNASSYRYPEMWRWWDGVCWSLAVRDDEDLGEAGYCAKLPAGEQRGIEWNDYWPADARVPRLAPEDFGVGARWVCAKPLFTTDFVGMELRVSCLKPHTLEWDGPRGTYASSLSLLPDEHYVPRRCVGPQTRWDFPMLRVDRCLETALDTVRGAGVQVVAHSGHQCEALEVKPAPGLKEPPIGSRWTHRRDPKKRVFEVLAVTDFSEIVGRQPGQMLDYVMLRHPSGCVTPVSLRNFKRTAVPTT